jgi:3'-phosphoadenosine 5'-phosphosulfate (PAPS) 3'-phosphatase
VHAKADASPVTVADEAAEKIILADLAAIAPGVPVVAEEAVSAGLVPVIADRFFLVDPLDGTREFVSHRDEFTVNVALIEAGEPVLGVVFAPARGELYWGDVRAGKAGTSKPTRRHHAVVGTPMAVRAPPPPQGYRGASRSHRTAGDGCVPR